MNRLTLFNSEHFQELKLPSVQVYPGEILRIECNCIEQNRVLFKKLSRSAFSKIVIKRTLFRRLFISPSAEKYLLRRTELKKYEIELLCQKIGISPDRKLFELAEAQMNTIVLIPLMQTDKLILINTAGMYLSCLEVCNGIMQKILDNGGACLEITYPPYGGDSLDKVFGERLKVIGL